MIIIEIDHTGRIFHVMHTVPDRAEDRMSAAGRRFVSVPAMPAPAEDLLANWYVAPVPRPDMPVKVDRTAIAADGRDACVVTGLPEPCAMTVDGAMTEIPADESGRRGRVAFSTDRPGVYEVVITAWPYRDARFTVTAAAP